MADLIRREDALSFQDKLEHVICFSGETFSATKDIDLVAFLEAIPAVDAVEVRHEKWRIIKHKGDLQHYAHCDYCGFQYGAGIWEGLKLEGYSLYSYCPNCGARMDGHREDGDDHG